MPYHGGDLKFFSEKFNIPEAKILDFSSNINPLGPPDAVRELLPELIEELTRYPDPRAREMRQEIARHFPLWPENVLVGNGAMALLALAVRTLRPKKALLIEPCFNEYRHLLNLEKAEIHSVLLRESNHFEFKLPEIANALRTSDLVILAHPNNPTGTALPTEAVEELLATARRYDVFVILDEAFCDWCPHLSMAQYVRDNSYFLVVRSLTKFYGLAGIRAGYTLGARRLIEKMQARLETWSCNRFAQKLSVVALRDAAFRERTLTWFRDESRWFGHQLEGIEALKVYPSVANFWMCKIKLRGGAKIRPAEELYEFLGQRGIYIRPLGDLTGLDGSYFRVGLREHRENQKLVDALQEWAGRVEVV